MMFASSLPHSACFFILLLPFLPILQILARLFPHAQIFPFSLTPGGSLRLFPHAQIFTFSLTPGGNLIEEG